jgi:hypothetical protein
VPPVFCGLIFDGTPAQSWEDGQTTGEDPAICGVPREEYIGEERSSIMKTKNYLIVSTVIFTIVAVAHLIRLTMGWPAVLGTWNVPLSVSLVAVLVSASVAIWGMSLVRRS